MVRFFSYHYVVFCTDFKAITQKSASGFEGICMLQIASSKPALSSWHETFLWRHKLTIVAGILNQIIL